MFVFFFKQKTAYEVRISDWSSDVCSSDLRFIEPRPAAAQEGFENTAIDVHHNQRRPHGFGRAIRHGDLRLGKTLLGDRGEVVADLGQAGMVQHRLGFACLYAVPVEQLGREVKTLAVGILAQIPEDVRKLQGLTERPRSAERAVGKERVMPGTTRWVPYHYKT